MQSYVWDIVGFGPITVYVVAHRHCGTKRALRGRWVGVAWRPTHTTPPRCKDAVHAYCCPLEHLS
jgi:hypothetical protein